MKTAIENIVARCQGQHGKGEQIMFQGRDNAIGILPHPALRRLLWLRVVAKIMQGQRIMNAPRAVLIKLTVLFDEAGLHGRRFFNDRVDRLT